MSMGNYFQRDDRGFILLGALFALVFLSIIALSINRGVLLRLAVSANYRDSVQGNFGGLAASNRRSGS